MNRLEEMAMFVRVVEAGSFSAAARRTGMSKSLLSRRVAALEDRLAARLLNRTTRRLAPTETGAAFFERCQRILAEVEEAEALAAQLDAEPRGRLRLAGPMSFGFQHLAPAVAAFMAAHPDLTVELDLNDRFVDLVSEGHDMAVRIGRLAESSLIARRLAPCRLVVVASPDYLARRGTPETAADLAGHDCLVYSNRSIADEWRLTGVNERIAARLNPRLYANNGDALLAAAEAAMRDIARLHEARTLWTTGRLDRVGRTCAIIRSQLAGRECVGCALRPFDFFGWVASFQACLRCAVDVHGDDARHQADPQSRASGKAVRGCT